MHNIVPGWSNIKDYIRTIQILRVFSKDSSQGWQFSTISVVLCWSYSINFFFLLFTLVVEGPVKCLGLSFCLFFIILKYSRAK